MIDWGEVAAAEPGHDPRGPGRRAARPVGAARSRRCRDRAFALDQAGDAFRYMAQARHIGKVVVTRRRCGRARAAAPSGRTATYLVTGGLGGLGPRGGAVARSSAAPAQLVLVGRRAPGPAAVAAIERLRGDGAQVPWSSADVSVRRRRRGRARRGAGDAAAAARRRPRGRRARRRHAAAAGRWPRFARVLARQGGRRLAPARADARRRARLLRPVLVGGLGARLARPGQPRRRQRLPRRARAPPPGRGPAGAQHQLGRLGRGRRGRRARIASGASSCKASGP